MIPDVTAVLRIMENPDNVLFYCSQLGRSEAVAGPLPDSALLAQPALSLGSQKALFSESEN